MVDKIVKTDAEWQEILTPEQFELTRKKGTEPPFTGRYHNFKGKGTYHCIACDNSLFSSEAKYDSGTGWPSFFAPISPDSIETALDTSGGTIRTEVKCKRCGAHLGHVFNDGPPPSRQRYCMNSGALKFRFKVPK